jgi:hypothetical protein
VRQAEAYLFTRPHYPKELCLGRTAGEGARGPSESVELFSFNGESPTAMVIFRRKFLGAMVGLLFVYRFKILELWFGEGSSLSQQATWQPERQRERCVPGEQC